MIRFIDVSPSPYHAVAEAIRRLDKAGFTELQEASRWDDLSDGGYYIKRGGWLVAWSGNLLRAVEQSGFRIVGAHTDSPNLRVKPNPDSGTDAWQQVAVEVYGSALLNSWLDRDLGLSGRVGVVENSMTTTRLFVDDRPILHIPQLAIHLDREISQSGLKLNPQAHLQPLWASGPATPDTFRTYLAEQIDVDAGAIVSWDVMLHDSNPGGLCGLGNEFVSSARIDNLLSCWAALQAMLTVASEPIEDLDPVPVIVFFDHEEVGSVSATGAAGDLLARVLERLVATVDGEPEAFARAMARSIFVSADGAHATHPNYSERHDPSHPVALNAGPVIKHNANARYATDASGAATFELVCRDLEIPVQHFASRNDIPCGSTIGPSIAARLGMTTIDVGVAQLAMHSCREMCGAQDPALFSRSLTGFLKSRCSF